jgi:hypothetical protein
MKRALTLIIACFFAITIANAQTGWVTHRCDNRISVKFPLEPAENPPGSFIATNNTKTLAYVLTVVDFVQVANIDSVALAPVKTTPEFAAQLKTGILQSLPTVNLSDFTIGTWRGFTSYTATGVDDKMKRYDMFMVIIGNKLYSFSTITAQGESLEGRDIFLNSIMLSN